MKNGQSPNRLRVLRAEKRVSQHQVAQTLKCSQSRVSLLENGFATPTDSDIKRLCRLLRVEPSDIFPQVAA
jgi:transcriptional regulator with XRE-family HTH domain